MSITKSTNRLVCLASLLLVLAACSSGESTTENPSPPSAPANAGNNSAPTVGGTPPSSIAVGQQYSFTPTASDADGDALTFSVQNLPGWANFDTSTGTLTGVPAAGDVGNYSSISITVSDGSDSSSLPAFSIAVNQVALGSATLSWTAPTQNVDGSALVDLSGYTIYYGTSQGNYPNSISIDNPGITTYVVDNLSPATYYFVSTAVNAGGTESVFSHVAVKTIN